MMFARKPADLPDHEQALPGRDEAMNINPVHYVNGSSMVAPYPQGMQTIVLGMGCFWGAERKFRSIDGVYTTAVGYSAGITRNPTYQEVCTGLTGHNEVVLVVYNPEKVSVETLLKTFWESHNPTQGMRQGNDQGTQYRSGIYYTSESQEKQARQSLQNYQSRLVEKGIGKITTEILPLGDFFFAEDYHQQYLAKNPAGYCGLGGTGELLG
ncbi:MAG: peptide-methionine (S)-S-oxide reductase MsrA [Gammaproteobacteria bacterium]|nr:peptide-methionine (S)-S-oxide reductase MsrA [Gammaproteobacteria bacterium]